MDVIVGGVVLLIVGLTYLLLKREAKERHKVFMGEYNEERKRFETYKDFLDPSDKARLARRLGNAKAQLARRPRGRRLDEVAEDLSDVGITLALLDQELQRTKEPNPNTNAAFSVSSSTE